MFLKFSGGKRRRTPGTLLFSDHSGNSTFSIYSWLSVRHLNTWKCQEFDKSTKMMKMPKASLSVCVHHTRLPPLSSLVSHCFLCLCFLFILLSFVSPKCDGVRWSVCFFFSSLTSSNSRHAIHLCILMKCTAQLSEESCRVYGFDM